MDSANRRGFLKIAGAGAAAVGASSLVPLATGTTTAGAAVPAVKATVPAVKAASLPAAARGPLAAYITDVTTGEIAIMVEGHEVTFVDHDLVARLATALHSATPTSV